MAVVAISAGAALVAPDDRGPAPAPAASDGPPVDEVDLAGSWVVRDVAAAMTEPTRAPVTLVFDTAPRRRDSVDGVPATGRASGETECNGIGAAYVRDGTALRFGPVASTRALCVRRPSRSS